MSRYAEGMLADGEQVVLRSRQHWLAVLSDGRLAASVLVASLVLLAIASFGLEAGAAHFWVGLLAFVLMLGSLLVLARLWLAWRSQDYLVTNRRVLKVDGILRKRSADSSLEKINDAVLEQGIFGRMFGYGDLEILTAAEIQVDKFEMLAQAQTFKRTMLEEKNRLERDIRVAPSPPLRAVPQTTPEPDMEPPAPAADRAIAGAGGGEASPAGSSRTAPASDDEPASPASGTSMESPGTPRSQTAAEITNVLANLADLRDRGAISPEDYEAKKQDLLGRL